jgi:hypothetical protein
MQEGRVFSYICYFLRRLVYFTNAAIQTSISRIKKTAAVGNYPRAKVQSSPSLSVVGANRLKVGEKAADI